MQHDIKRGRPITPAGKLRAELGLTRQQVHQARRLAEIPESTFEEIMNSLSRITVGGILREWDMMNQHHRKRLPASLERMADELRKAGWSVFPPQT